MLALSLAACYPLGSSSGFLFSTPQPSPPSLVKSERWEVFNHTADLILPDSRTHKCWALPRDPKPVVPGGTSPVFGLIYDHKSCVTGSDYVVTWFAPGQGDGCTMRVARDSATNYRFTVDDGTFFCTIHDTHNHGTPPVPIHELEVR